MGTEFEGWGEWRGGGGLGWDVPADKIPHWCPAVRERADGPLCDVT